MSTADKIQKLKDLLDSGAITQDEYVQLKKEVIEEIDSKSSTFEPTPVNSNSQTAKKTVDEPKSIVNGIGRMYDKHPYGVLFVPVAIIALLALLVAYSSGVFHAVKLSGTEWIGSPALVLVGEERPKENIEFYSGFPMPDRGRGFWEGKGEFEWWLSLERFGDMNKLTIRFENTSAQRTYYVKYDVKDNDRLCLYSEPAGVGPLYYLNLQ